LIVDGVDEESIEGRGKERKVLDEVGGESGRQKVGGESGRYVEGRT
jgi:hypothetical protein